MYANHLPRKDFVCETTVNSLAFAHEAFYLPPLTMHAMCVFTHDLQGLVIHVYQKLLTL